MLNIDKNTNNIVFTCLSQGVCLTQH